MAGKSIDFDELSDGERCTVETLYRKYYKNVLEYFRRRVFLFHKAEELTADTFIRIT